MLVRVDRVGYATGCTKQALVMSDRALPHATFTVLDHNGKIAAEGPLRGDHGPWNARWRHVYRADFSGLTRPGVYTLRVADVASPIFSISSGQKLFAPLVDHAVTFFQAQRDGGDVIPGALHRRPSHLNDRSATVFRPPSYRAFLLAGPLVATGATRDVSGGWFDAGDYLKFAGTASFSDLLMLVALRDFGPRVHDRKALDAEARFGLAWLLKLWDPAHRTLVYQVGLGDGNGRRVLGDHDLWRLPQADDKSPSGPSAPTRNEAHRPAFSMDPPGSGASPNLAGRLAGVFGLCAQVYTKSRPELAHRCLAAGQTIFDQADTALRGPLLASSPAAYYAEPEWRDDMELGAVELYLGTLRSRDTTGLPHADPNYYLVPAGTWADQYMRSASAGKDTFNLFDVAALAHFDLVQVMVSERYRRLQLIPHNGIDLPTDPKALLSDMHDQLVLANRLADPFGLRNVATNVDTVAHALGLSIEARLYDALVRRPQFEQAAQDQIDWVLGRNAWGTSFVVDGGTGFPHCLAHQVANLSGALDGHPPLLTGAVVNGPTAPGGLKSLGAPDGHRACSHSLPAKLDKTRMRYRDEVGSFATSEPSDDLAALSLLAFAQASAQ